MQEFTIVCCFVARYWDGPPFALRTAFILHVLETYLHVSIMQLCMTQSSFALLC